MLIAAALILYGFGPGYQPILKGYYEAVIGFNEGFGGARQRVQEVSFSEWYNLVAGSSVLLFLMFAIVYAARPMAVLGLMLADRNTEANMHKVSLFVLERRLRAALILYGHAAQCGRSLSARGLLRDSMANSAREISQAERLVLRAWKTSRAGRFKPSRRRRSELKNHAGRVVSVMRTAAARVDADPDEGMRELGILLVRIGDRLAEGRAGALLDESELQGHDAVRDREVLRTLVAALTVAAAAVGIALLHLPEQVAGPLTTVAGVVVLVTLFRGAAKGVETVSLLLGSK
ncbi:hypothetical protein GCM10017776_50450 [Streptomyces griseoluteus]|nr:hypothetical protein GCM10017776_50450 [Streptomyces griseoluteus]